MVNEKSIKNAYLVAFIESKGHQDMAKSVDSMQFKLVYYWKKGESSGPRQLCDPSCCSHFTGLQRDVYECIVFVSD